MERDKKKSSGGSGLGYLLIGAIGLVGGFLANEFLSKKDDKKEKVESNNQPIPQSPQINSNNSQSTTNNNTDDDECNDIFCPITMEVMTDPVISKKCGHSFENQAITEWLKKHTTCPKCHCELSQNDLIKNYSLKNTIEYMQKQQKNT